MAERDPGLAKTFGLTTIVREVRTIGAASDEHTPSSKQPGISYTCAVTTSEKPGTTHFPAQTLPELARLIAEAYVQTMSNVYEARQTHPAEINHLLKTSDSTEIYGTDETGRQAFPLNSPDMHRLDDLVEGEIKKYMSELPHHPANPA
jgi:hypothetical protein